MVEALAKQVKNKTQIRVCEVVLFAERVIIYNLIFRDICTLIDSVMKYGHS